MKKLFIVFVSLLLFGVSFILFSIFSFSHPHNDCACPGFLYFNVIRYVMSADGTFSITLENGPIEINVTDFQIKDWEEESWLAGASKTDFSELKNIEPGEMLDLWIYEPSFVGNPGEIYDKDVNVVFSYNNFTEEDNASCFCKYDVEAVER